MEGEQIIAYDCRKCGTTMAFSFNIINVWTYACVVRTICPKCGHPRTTVLQPEKEPTEDGAHNKKLS